METFILKARGFGGVAGSFCAADFFKRWLEGKQPDIQSTVQHALSDGSLLINETSGSASGSKTGVWDPRGGLDVEWT